MSIRERYVAGDRPASAFISLAEHFAQEFPARHFQHQCLVQRWLGGKIERFKALGMRELGATHVRHRCADQPSHFNASRPAHRQGEGDDLHSRRKGAGFGQEMNVRERVD